MMKIGLLIAVFAIAGCVTHTVTTPRDANGKLHGVLKTYWPSGQLAEKSEWNHGMPLQGRFYNEQGMLVSEIRNGTGWRHGPEFSEFYQDGKYIRGAH
jgi:antitoxin component YwqK of YwqJK toxin-antitoxin module